MSAIAAAIMQIVPTGVLSPSTILPSKGIQNKTLPFTAEMLIGSSADLFASPLVVIVSPSMFIKTILSNDSNSIFN